ncbi:MAG TPA: type II secretion system protein [Candidatus Saccharimonadales bacterium]|nr:type II secretion system protein [Candidatus Saccharimonadales bacterium]
MNVQQTKKEKGFTIIEVVLVLAIAGLIFLMVFIALPALQRGQRDGQRRSDVSRFVSQLNSYATNNKGQLPANENIKTFAASYLKWKNDASGEFNNPLTGNGYEITGGNEVPNSDGSEIVYTRNATCSGEGVDLNGGNRQAAIRVALEGGGVFCQDAK